MNQKYNNAICKEHSGFKARIEDLENNVSRLWKKWDGMQKMVLGVFITLSINLICVILLLVRTFR